MVSIKDCQKNVLKCMVNLNIPVPKTTAATEPVWKILVFDRTGQDIISPLLSVKELRELGVTLHVVINSKRDSIPEVPVIYFVLPTDENISQICQDFKNQLYDHFYLNFITPISRQKLEDLATTAYHANITASICKVVDQYSYFVSLENELFILREHEKDSISYFAINRCDITESEMDGCLNSVVEGLFSVFVSLGVIPVIRCPKGNAAEMVAMKLDKKLRENLQDTRNNLFLPSSDLSRDDNMMPKIRPLFVILDRNMDMATPLHHTWTYQALAHDVLSLQLNHLCLNDSPPSGDRPKKGSSKTYDLNVNHDKFWSQHRGSPFPQVAEAVQEELESYRSQEDEVKRLKAAMGLEGNEEAASLLSDTTAKLNSAVSSLPELLERKKYIDMHTTIATSMLDMIKSRKLDIYFETEEKVLSKAMVDKGVMDIITDPESGTPEDKMRLYLIFLLCDVTGSLSGDEGKKYEAALLEAGCDMKPLNYMKRWKTVSKLPISHQNTYDGGTKTVSMFSKLMNQGSQFVMEGVKNLVVKKNTLPFTRMVDALMENRSIAETEDFHYLDPKTKRTDRPVASSSSSSSSPFMDAMVFVVGGGNYIEYQNMMELCKNKALKGSNRRIIYGATDLMNADQFLNQLSKLGQQL